MSRVRVFLSSTFIDLRKHRAAVVEALQRVDHQVTRMELFGARPQEPLQASLHEVEQADLFVGIYAHRYGYEPAGTGQSVTESELRRAELFGKPVLCFVVDEDHPWPPKFVECVTAEKLAALKRHINEKWTIEQFTTPTDLAHRVTLAVTRLVQATQENSVTAARVVGTALAQTVAMTVVDVMRLLWVQGSAIAKTADARRYEQFLRVATRHFSDLQGDLARFGLSLSAAQTDLTVRIGRRLSSMISELGDEHHASRHVDDFFAKATELAKLADEFVQLAAADEREKTSALLTTVIQQRAPQFDERVPHMTRDEIYRLRYDLQTRFLEVATSLRSIAQDTDFVAAIPYFLLDLRLLERMR